jgi:hypothetical protein
MKARVITILPPSREVALDPEVVRSICDTLGEIGVPYLAGKTWTTDAFSRETPARVERRRAEGCPSKWNARRVRPQPVSGACGAGRAFMAETTSAVRSGTAAAGKTAAGSVQGCSSWPATLSCGYESDRAAGLAVRVR